MANTRTFKPSFAGGEISEEMFARLDDSKFQSGAALLQNMISTPLGPAVKRPGFEDVNSTKDNGVARLIPFVYSSDQTMIIELGDHYARFHTQGETLQYSLAGAAAWDPPPSADISYTLSTPSVITWVSHGLVTGNPIRFYVFGSGAIYPLPGGLQVGYTYTVNVLDADTFNIIDADGVYVALTVPPGGIVVNPTYTNYPGGGGPSTTLTLGPNASSTSTSGSVGGLASHIVVGGLVNLNISYSVSAYTYRGGGGAAFQYSTNGMVWSDLTSTSSSSGGSYTAQIALSNLNQLQLRVRITGSTGPSGSLSIDGSISSWSVDIPTGGTVNTAELRSYRYYTAGDIVTYGGQAYVAVMTDSGGVTVPGTDVTIWTLLPSDLTYEIGTPYAAADLFAIHYVQSNDVVTLVHPAYPPSELRRLGATQWSLVPIAFEPALSAPLGVAVSASPGYTAKIASVAGSPSLVTTVSNHTLALGDGIYISPDTTGQGFYLVDKVPVDSTGALIPNELYVMDYSGNVVSSPGFAAGAQIQYGAKIFDITNYYVVTAIAKDAIQESAVSVEVSVLNNLNVTGSFNIISWSAVPTAFRYYVYKKRNGLYGYIGETPADTLIFNDNNIAADMSITPPIYEALFAKAGDYPGAVGYCQQRRTFAATTNKPQNLWMAKTGTESDFSYSLPIKDTDRIAVTVPAREMARIRHIIPLNQLVLLSSSVEVCVNADVMTPSSIGLRPQSYIGASDVQPTIANNTLVFAAARGGHVREMGYQWQLAGYMTGDMSLRAAHLFDGLTIVDQAYMKAPWSVIWFVSSNGNLLGLTYVPEEQVGAWHHHVTRGAFESIACVAEGADDRLYAVVRRTVGGVTVRRIERMGTFSFATPADCMFLDSAETYVGAPATVFSGLDHLEGETVSILGDGAVMQPQPVSGGSVTIEYPCSKVHIGLAYTVDIKTLPLVLQIEGMGQGRTKNVNHIWIRVKDSSSIWAGPDLGKLVEYAQRRAEPYGSPPSLVTDQIKIPFFGTWQDSGQIFIQQTDPLPLTIIGLTIEAAIGG